MTNWMKYSEIKKLKGLKFSQTQVSKLLGLDRKTISKYWNMDLEEYSSLLNEAKQREKKAMIYENDILSWLKEYPDMSAAQIYDWLQERYNELPFTERTLRLFVAEMREEHNIIKSINNRQYVAVVDLPMGYQAQVDLGEIWLRNINNKRVKLYCFVMVLSHSRYKFVYWSDIPFTALTFIDAHNKAFIFFGGRPIEIAYDQDKVLAVSENHGDIIYTEVFQNYLDALGFKVYLCRKNDPESKGRIEAVVKYVKQNFANHRTYSSLAEFNDDCIKWLERRGNGKMHETTKKIPAEVFALEKQHLLPVSHYGAMPNNDIVHRYVRKDNTILYLQNRYCVPVGTYEVGKKVSIEVKEGKLIISDFNTKEIYATHNIHVGKGELITLKHTNRDMSSSVESLYNKVFECLGYRDNARTFLEEIRKDKPRYYRDQLNLIFKASQKVNDTRIIQSATDYCMQNKLWSASEYVRAVKYYEEVYQGESSSAEEDIVKIPAKYREVKPNTRDINEYAELIK